MHTREGTTHSSTPHEKHSSRRGGLFARWMTVLFVGGLGLGIVVPFIRGAGSKQKNLPSIHISSHRDDPRLAERSSLTDSVEPPVVSASGREKSRPVSITTNSSGYVTEIYIENGKRRRVIKEPPPVFSNTADQLIAMIMSIEPGQELPPMPIDASVNEAFKHSLTNAIVILPTDSAKVAAMKQAVLETRVELLKLIEQGISVEQALREHCQLVNENARIRTDALLEVKRIYESGDVESALEYVEVMNEAFDEMGIKPIQMPGKGRRPRNSGAVSANGQ